MSANIAPQPTSVNEFFDLLVTKLEAGAPSGSSEIARGLRVYLDHGAHIVRAHASAITEAKEPDERGTNTSVREK